MPGSTPGSVRRGRIVVVPLTALLATVLLLVGLLPATSTLRLAATVQAMQVQAGPVHEVVDGHHVALYAPTAPVRAMLVLLPGLYLSSADTEAGTSELLAHSARAGWLMAYPDEVSGSWNAGDCCQPAVERTEDDVSFVARLAATLRREYAVPAGVPLILGGFSNGAMLTEEVLCRRPGLVAGALLMAGNLQDPRCTSARAREILFFHGTGDRTVPIAGSRYSTFLRTRLLPDAATIRAAEFGLLCGATTRHRSANAAYASTVCGPDRLTYIAERGGHAWLTGDSSPATSTLTQVELMIRRLGAG